MLLAMGESQSFILYPNNQIKGSKVLLFKILFDMKFCVINYIYNIKNWKQPPWTRYFQQRIHYNI